MFDNKKRNNIGNCREKKLVCYWKRGKQYLPPPHAKCRATPVTEQVVELLEIKCFKYNKFVTLWK